MKETTQMTPGRWMTIAAVLALSACATDMQADLRQRLDPLVGQTQAELVRRVGTPSRTAPGPVLHYVIFWPTMGGPNSNAGWNVPLGHQCDIAFRIEGGRVAGYSFTGSVCGMGGLPYVAP